MSVAMREAALPTATKQLPECRPASPAPRLRWKGRYAQRLRMNLKSTPKDRELPRLEPVG